MRKVGKTAKKWPKISIRFKMDVEWNILKIFFRDSSRTVSSLVLQNIGLRVAMLRLRKSMLKAQKNVILDFELEFMDEVGQFFWPGCRTLSRIMCKKNFTKIFTIHFSIMFQSQNLERHRNMNFFISKHHPFLVFSGSNESQLRVLQDW